MARPRPLLLLVAAALSAASVIVASQDRGRTPRAVAAPVVAPSRPPAAVDVDRARPNPLLAPRAPLDAHVFEPPLSARSAILVDASSGTVVWTLRPHVRRQIASTTKIMTAVLALERLGPNDVVTVDRSVPRVALVREGLRAGERVRTWKLLYGMLLYSGNDDALALAVASAGSRPTFVALMNARAKELGLRDTHFASPSGVVDRDNRSSAWDLAALARYAMRDGRFRSVVRTRIKEVAWSAPTYSKIYVNKNQLLGSYRGADGVKTGYTGLAGHCLVASAHRGDVRLIAVVLHSGDPFRDARRLLNYGFRVRG